MSKISMMFKIVSLLQTKYIITARELAEILETTPRNIKAYIESLRDADVPIQGLSGKTGGYFLNDAYEFKAPRLDDMEYSALLLAEEFLNRSNGFIYENEIRTAFSKIKAAQGEIMGNSDLIDKYNFIDTRNKYDINKSTRDYLFSMQQAIFNRNSTLIKYNNPTKKQITVRKFDPYNLIFRDSSWYVIGFCHYREKIRTFKLMRILSIEILDENFHIPAEYSPKTHYRDTFSLIKGKEHKVEIQFFHPASVWVSEKHWLPTQKIVKLKNDSIIFIAKVDGLEEIKKWILGYGKLAKVIKPQELIDEIQQEVRQVSNLYATDG